MKEIVKTFEGCRECPQKEFYPDKRNVICGVIGHDITDHFDNNTAPVDCPLEDAPNSPTTSPTLQICSNNICDYCESIQGDCPGFPEFKDRCFSGRKLQRLG